MDRSKTENKYKLPKGGQELEGLINGMINAFQQVIDAYEKPQHRFTYPLTRGFGYDESPPPLLMTDVELDSPVFGKTPSGKGPFEVEIRHVDKEAEVEE